MQGKVLKIREIGDPILKEVCKIVDVNKNKKQVKEVIANLKTTFDYLDGFGIAAPQIGENLRIVVIGVDKEKCKYKGAEDIPVTIMINPVIKIVDKENTNEEYEGCFSVPVIRGKVKRYDEIEVEFLDDKFNKLKWHVKDYTARLIQHECDHLDGIVFVEKVDNPKDFSTLENLKKFDNKM